MCLPSVVIVKGFVDLVTSGVLELFCGAISLLSVVRSMPAILLVIFIIKPPAPAFFDPYALLACEYDPYDMLKLLYHF